MLRKTLTALTLACFLSTSGASQVLRTVGAKLGGVAASQDWKYTVQGVSLDTSTRWGLDIVGFLEWFNTPIFSLVTEGHYLQKGFKVSFPVVSSTSPDGTGTVITQSQQVNYFSIPVLLKCRATVAASSLYVLAGPRVDLLLGKPDQGYREVLDKFHSHDFGITIGVGAEAIAISPFMLGAEFRYSPTLDNSYSTDLLTVRNSSLELLIVLQAK